MDLGVFGTFRLEVLKICYWSRYGIQRKGGVQCSTTVLLDLGLPDLEYMVKGKLNCGDCRLEGFLNK